MKFRLIEQETHDAAMNMAIDHAICESVANGREIPTIRFYKWEKSSISLGAYQNPNEIDKNLCRKFDVEIVRRMTGGRVVFHDKRDFTYSVIAPIKTFGYSIEKAYREVCYSIIDTLTEIGIKAEFENKNDVMVKGKKISGNASRMMDKGVYLQHGTIVYGIDFDIMPKLLNVDADLVRERVTSIMENRKVSQKRAYTALRNSFAFGKDVSVQKLSDYEMQRASDLAKSTYSTINVAPNSFVKNKGACYVERGAD
jgi:lipoate-protein ligase A